MKSPCPIKRAAITVKHALKWIRGDKPQHSSQVLDKSLYAADSTSAKHHVGPRAYRTLSFSSKFLSSGKQKLKEQLILSLNRPTENIYPLEKK